MMDTHLPWAARVTQNLWPPEVAQPLPWPHAPGRAEAGGAAIHPGDDQYAESVFLEQSGRGQAEREPGLSQGTQKNESNRRAEEDDKQQ